MATVDFRVGDRAHITVDSDVCRSCTTKACVTACPANLFAPTADGGILFNYEECFECGTCYMVCNTRAPSPGPIPTAATASCSTTDEPAPTRRPAGPTDGAAGGGLPADHRPAPGGRSADRLDRAGTAWGSGSPPPTAPPWSTPCGSPRRGRGGWWPWPPGPPSRRAGAPRGGRARAPRSCGSPCPDDDGRRRPLRAASWASDEHDAGPGRWWPPSRPWGAAVPGAVRRPLGRPGHRGPARLPGPRAGRRPGPRPGVADLRARRPGPRHRRCSAERRLDGGWRERLRVPLPAVCSVEGAGVRLRRASLAGALAAESVDRPRGPAPLGGRRRPRTGRAGPRRPSRPFPPRTRVLPAPEGDDPRIRLLALTGALVAHDPPTVVGPVGAAEAADELIAFLVRHGYLDRPPDGRPAHRPGRATGEPARRPDLARGGPPAGVGAVLLVPVGSTEQHGPHLPVTTDTDIAVAVAAGAAADAGPAGGGPGRWPTGRAASTRASPAPCPSGRRPPSWSWSSWAGRPPATSPTWCWSRPTAATPGPVARAVARLAAEGRAGHRPGRPGGPATCTPAGPRPR